jgi:glycosyltransferase involved in cell wall biosynthesis
VIESPNRRDPALLVFSDDWGGHPSSCQHLIRHLLGHRVVYWVNTIGTRPPRLDLATLSRGLEKIRQWTRPPGRPDHRPERLQVLNPVMWPWFRSALDRRLNRALLLRRLTPFVQSLPVPPVAVTTIPIVADLIGPLRVARWVYYCVDDFGLWPGLDQAPLRAMEERLIRRADVLIAVSEILREKIDWMGRPVHLLTHGIDLEHWRAGGDGLSMPQLDGLERPLVVFWGVIDRRMDPQLVGRLASDLARGTMVLVGPESDPDPAIAAMSRVVRLPPLPYEQLPSLARQAAVLIMPYADIPVNRAIQPLKLKEYLATGRPAVVRDLPATRDWADCLDLADTPEAFSAAVRTRLETGLPESQAAARARLAGESWDEKARAFERWALHTEPVVESVH